MGLRNILQRSSVSKGYCAVYVGENQKKRFVIPITYLNQPCLQDLLSQTREEFDYHHSIVGLTFHCKDNIFTDLISQLSQQL